MTNITINKNGKLLVVVETLPALIRIFAYNENHDEKGRFSEGDGGGGSVSEKERSAFSDPSTSKEVAKSTESSFSSDIIDNGKSAFKDANVDWYASEGYHASNSYLRDPSGYEPVLNSETGELEKVSDIQPKILDISSKIATSPPLPEGTVLYRGLPGKIGTQLANAEPGSIYTDRAFQSFSVNPTTASEFAATPGSSSTEITVMRTVTNGEQSAIYSNARGEYEAILQRGTSWAVASHDTIASGNFITHIVTVVPA